jgi:hypothetical protein
MSFVTEIMISEIQIFTKGHCSFIRISLFTEAVYITHIVTCDGSEHKFRQRESRVEGVLQHQKLSVVVFVKYALLQPRCVHSC